MRKAMVVVCMGAVISTFAGKAAPLFIEDFGSLAEGTAISANNTSLTYARFGTGAGAYLNARSPGSFSGSSALLLATSTSLTGLGVTNGTFTPFNVGTLSFSLRTPGVSGSSALYALVGSGASFSGNGAFVTTELTAGFLISGGQIQTRNSSSAWQGFGSSLLDNTAYDLRIVFNGSSSTVNYGTDSLAAGTADLWLDGTLFGDDVSIRNAVGTSAFRFYTTGNTSALPYEIDNIQIFDSAVHVPEPSMISLFVTGCLFVFGTGRRIGISRRNH
jgi:hypothetical protein